MPQSLARARTGLPPRSTVEAARPVAPSMTTPRTRRARTRLPLSEISTAPRFAPGARAIRCARAGSVPPARAPVGRAGGRRIRTCHRTAVKAPSSPSSVHRARMSASRGPWPTAKKRTGWPSRPCTLPSIVRDRVQACPSAPDRLWAKTRATRSLPPPAGKPTITRTGREGYSCARTGIAADSAKSAASAIGLLMGSSTVE